MLLLVDRYLNFFLFFITSLLVGSVLDFAILKLVYGILVIVYLALNKKLKKNWTIPIIITSLWLYGLTLSLYQIYFNHFAKDLSLNILLRARLFAIEMGFAIVVYLYLSTKKLKDIFTVLCLAAGLNCAAGIYQLYMNPLERLKMLAYEPSMASAFYTFAFMILISEIKKKTFTGWRRILSASYLTIGLFIRSKIQYFIIVVILITTFTKNFFFSIYLFVCIFLSVYFIFENFEVPRMPHNQISGTMHAVTVLCRYGMHGMSAQSQLGDSFTVRLSAFYISSIILVKNPLGIGFGTFQKFFLDEMKVQKLEKVISGSEMNEIYTGLQQATPKSFLMEIFISTGWISIGIFIYLILLFSKYNKFYPELTSALIGLSMCSLFVESIPMFALIVVGYLLLKKNLSLNDNH